MARPKKERIIQIAPHFSGFKTIGVQCNNIPKVSINFEEFEALKLCDYEFFTQDEAAKLMNISRPTFTRIYESVRRKIAKAFVEGACMTFEGGNFSVTKWYGCKKCKIIFTMPENGLKCCPLCKAKEIQQAN